MSIERLRFLHLFQLVLILPVLSGLPAERAEGAAPAMCRRVMYLRPDTPALTAIGVPPLTQQPPDADRLGTANLRIAPEKPCRWVFSPGEQIRLAVSGDAPDYAVLTAWDWENRPISSTSFTAPFNAAVSIRIDGRGTYVLTLDAMKAGNCESRLVRSFSVCPANESRRKLWDKSGFWVGQCSFPGWQGARASDGRLAHPPEITEDESRNLDAELVARMGAQVARLDMSVIRRDDKGLDLDFSISDKCVKAFVSRGLDLDLQLFAPYGRGRGPILSRYSDVPEDKSALYPIQETAYRHYIREAVRRYGKYARFVQVRNEPGNIYQYMGDPDDYTAEVRQAADETRKQNPHALVTNGGYCNTLEVTQRIIAGIQGLTDFSSYHCHGDLPILKYFFAQMQQLHLKSRYTRPRFANTEMGFYMPSVGGERTNAVAEMQKILYCWAHENLGVMLYSSRETWWPRQYQYNGSSDYGFVDYFFCPRFVYGTVSAFLDRYAGFRFSRILRESENLHAYEFQSGDRRMVAVFACKEPVTVEFESDGRSACILDPMGNERPCLNAGHVSVRASEYPTTVLFDKATEVRLLN